MGLGVVKEWRCLEHGPFDASHPICPEHGCRSEAVFQEFRTPPKVGTSMVRRHNAGIKRTVDMMKLGNLRTAREGESAYGGNLGQQVLWGDQCRSVFGKGFSEMMQVANQPLVVRKRDGGELRLDRNNGMADAADATGITRNRLPKPQEVTRERGDKKSAAVAKKLEA